MKLGERAVAVRLHEGGGQVADHRGVAAALGDLCFADVVDDVEIVVRHLADQHVRPVVTRQRDLLPRGEFEAAVGAEVHHRVRLETVAQVEVSRDIGVRRGHLDAVDEFVLVAPFAGEGLRHQDDVAELNPADGHIALRRAEGSAGEFAVTLRHRPVEVGGHALFDPCVVFAGSDGDGLHARHGFFARAVARVGAEGGVVRFDLLIQLFRRFGERAGRVAGLLQTLEHVEDGFRDAEPAGGGLPADGAVIDDRDLLFGIRLALQVRRLSDQFGEALETVGNRAEFEQPAVVAVERREHEGDRSAVEFRHGDALAQHAAGHAALVAQVLPVRLADLDRAEERDVVFLQEFDRLFAETAVRLVDDQVRPDLLEHREQVPHAVGGDDVEPFLLKRADQLFQRAAAVAGEQADGRGILLVAAGLFVPGQILLIGLEGVVLADMEERMAFDFFRRLRSRGAEPFPVDLVADIVEHAPEVLLSAVAEVGGDLLPLSAGQRVERGFGAGRSGDVERLLQRSEELLLLLREVEPHAEEDDHVIILQLLAAGFGPPERSRFDGRIQLLVHQRREQIFGVVHEGDPGVRAVTVIEADGRGDGGDDECGDQVLGRQFAHFSFLLRERR